MFHRARGTTAPPGELVVERPADLRGDLADEAASPPPDPRDLPAQVARPEVGELRAARAPPGSASAHARRVCVDEAEERRLPAPLVQLPRDLVGEHPGEAVAAEKPRPLRLEAGELVDVMGGHVLQARIGELVVEADSLDSVHRLVGIEAPDEVAVEEQLAVDSVQQEERRPGCARPERNDRRPGSRGFPPASSAPATWRTVACSKSTVRGSLTRKTRSTSAISLTARSEWPPSAKKSSVDADRLLDAEHPLPDLAMPAPSWSAGGTSGGEGEDSSSGTGSALRSTLPLGVQRQRSSTTNAAGTM